MAYYSAIRYGGSPLTGLAASGASQVLIKTVTAETDATISFVNLFDNTYREYIFKYVSMHPGTDNVFLSFNGSTDGGSNYNATKTTTFVRAHNNEGDSANGLAYMTSSDLAQSTAFQVLEDGNSSDNDHGSSGYLHLWEPYSTTYVKNFWAQNSTTSAGDYVLNSSVGGYFNTTSAINAIQFKFSSGNMDTGTIKLYGVN